MIKLICDVLSMMSDNAITSLETARQFCTSADIFNREVHTLSGGRRLLWKPVGGRPWRRWPSAALVHHLQRQRRCGVRYTLHRKQCSKG